MGPAPYQPSKALRDDTTKKAFTNTAEARIHGFPRGDPVRPAPLGAARAARPRQRPAPRGAVPRKAAVRSVRRVNKTLLTIYSVI